MGERIILPSLSAAVSPETLSDFNDSFFRQFNDDYFSCISKSLLDTITQSNVLASSAHSLACTLTTYTDYLSKVVLSLDFSSILSSYSTMLPDISDTLRQAQLAYQTQKIAPSQAAASLLDNTKEFLSPTAREEFKKEVESKEKPTSKFTWQDFISLASFIVALLSFLLSQKPNPQLSELSQQTESVNSQLQEIHDDLQYFRSLCESTSQPAVDFDELKKLADDPQLCDALNNTEDHP